MYINGISIRYIPKRPMISGRSLKVSADLCTVHSSEAKVTQVVAGRAVSCEPRYQPGPRVRVFVGGVAHGAELRHKKVVAAVVGWSVLFNVGKLHKLGAVGEKKKKSSATT